MRFRSSLSSRPLRAVLPLLALAALMVSVPVLAQSAPAKTDDRKADAAADAGNQNADRKPREAAAADRQDAERRKPKRNADREPHPEREREEEDGGR